jgi:hypothetical protein
MLPAWMIDKIKKDEELARRDGERHIDRPSIEERGIRQKEDAHRDSRFAIGR